MNDVQPSFKALYIQDDSHAVMCGECLDNEFECWPDDWSEIPVAVREEYACDVCGRD
jgi:hypothetical protein